MRDILVVGLRKVGVLFSFHIPAANVHCSNIAIFLSVILFFFIDKSMSYVALKRSGSLVKTENGGRFLGSRWSAPRHDRMPPVVC
jgi:hypothetical protein